MDNLKSCSYSMIKVGIYPKQSAHDHDLVYGI